MKKMDFNRSYGTVYGVAGVAYEQDGIHYNAHGDAVVSEIKCACGREFESEKGLKTHARSCEVA